MNRISLYDISKDILELEEKINKSYDPETGEILDEKLFEEVENTDADLLAERFTDKCENIIKFIRSRELEIKAIKEEEKRVKEYRQSLEKSLERFKEYVSYVITHTGLKKVETPVGRLSTRKSESVKILEGAEIPKKYLTEKIEVKPNKTELKKALKGGEKIKGVTLEEKKNIAIK